MDTGLSTRALGNFELLPSETRVVFGDGVIANLGEELDGLGLRSILVVSGQTHRAQGDALAHSVDAVGRFDGAVAHTPTVVTAEALKLVDELVPDCLVALGGGSAIGLAKAIALVRDVTLVAIPTTFSGSEQTSIVGQSDGQLKTTTRSPRVRPRLVLYDVELTDSLPSHLAAASGVNALAHAIEALYARDASPLVRLEAAESVRVLGASLPLVVTDSAARDARRDALYGAMLAGRCLASSEMALQHRLSHLLGGSFSLPHAETHAVLLPQIVDLNLAALPTAGVLADVFGRGDVAGGLFDWIGTLGLERSLDALGFGEDQIERAAEAIVQAGGFNPVVADLDAMRMLLTNAWAGTRPMKSAL